jgi:predicted nucleic acid-binding protein
MQKIFLDTNIILDFLDDQRPHHEYSQQLMRQLTQENWHVTISEDMLSTIFYI